MANIQSPQTQSQSQSPKNRSMSKAPARNGQEELHSEGESKSIGSVIGESIGKNAQVKVDEVFSQATHYFDEVKTYLRESPREALGLGLTLAAVGWALLYTKPGRQLFDKGATTFGPQISKSVSGLFSAGKQNSQSNQSSAV